MSMNLDSLAGADRATGTLGRALAALGLYLSARVRGLWDAYWDYQLRRTTVLMLEALDDRVLKDIGLGRSEIWPAVFGRDAARARPYDPHWRKPADV
jgi:uncharacterized protein YjiS (DUF1127 family)